MRNTIKAGIEEYVAMEDRLRQKISKIDTETTSPSAPSEHLDDEAPSAPATLYDDAEPSAPALIQTFHSPECVVCLERKVSHCPSQGSFAKKIIRLAANYVTLLPVTESHSMTALISILLTPSWPSNRSITIIVSHQPFYS